MCCSSLDFRCEGAGRCVGVCAVDYVSPFVRSLEHPVVAQHKAPSIGVGTAPELYLYQVLDIVELLVVVGLEPEEEYVSLVHPEHIRGIIMHGVETLRAIAVPADVSRHQYCVFHAVKSVAHGSDIPRVLYCVCHAVDVPRASPFGAMVLHKPHGTPQSGQPGFRHHPHADGLCLRNAGHGEIAVRAVVY